MLNIFKLKKKDNISKIKNNVGDYIGAHRQNVPSNKEWYNSIYVYNKKTTRFLPVAHDIITNLINSYFTMFNKNLEKVKSRRMDIRIRRLSARKIWVSKPEIKHTNDKLVITIYVYNREYNYYFNQLSKLNFTWGFNIIKKFRKLNNSNYWKIKKGNHFFSQINNLKLINLFSHTIKTLKKNSHILCENLNISKPRKSNIFISYIRKSLIKDITFLRYKQILLFNKFKFNDNYLIPLINLLQKIYKKNVEFNIISLKNYYLSSSILSQIVTTKIKNKDNKPLRVLKKALHRIKTPILNKRTVKREDSKFISVQNIILNNYINSNKEEFVNSYLNTNINKVSKNLNDMVVNNINNKLISGVFLKASGRLTRRITAQRSICKFKYVGTLKNVNSSYKGLSTVMVRGNNKSNVENTFLKSKTRIGSFGLKGWVASY